MSDQFDLISDNDSNILPHFLLAAGIHVPRKAIYALQDENRGAGPMSLGVMARTLDRLSIRYDAAQFRDAAEAAARGVALISLRDLGSLPSKPPSHSFYALMGLEDDGTPILHNAHGEVLQLSPSAWRRRWNGIGIYLTEPKPTLLCPDLDQLLQEEATSRQAYLERVRYVEGAIDGHLCDTIVAQCERQRIFRRSRVGPDIVSGSRTSFTGYLPPNLSEPVIAALRRQEAWGFTEIEPVQIVRYRPKQEFRAHIDVSRNFLRPMTALLYLNDDFAGGGTAFPRLGKSWSAKKGSLLIFPNLDARGDPIAWALHAGERVRAGTKYACNIWAKRAAAVLDG
jgi:hypothetical protein